MPHSRLYLPYIESETIVSKSLLKPKNVYKIEIYQYAEGSTKRLIGTTTSYVFLIGIFNRQLNCIKISEVMPRIFINWMKNLFQKRINEEIIDNSIQLSELLVRTNITGNTLFTNHIRNNKIYTGQIPTYRTYNLSGIKQIKEVKFKKDFIKTLAGITPQQKTTNKDENNN